MLDRSQTKSAIDAGGGILRLEPAWVPRSFMIPGERLKLHPRDLYALGGHRGGINERWFSSTTNADNGPGTPADEGLSYVRLEDGKRFLLRDAVSEAGDLLLGSAVMEREKGWNLLCKFFDNMGPIPHHMHQTDAQAKLLGRRGKPEAYYFPPQYNKTDNNFPHTFMGLEPGTTKADVRRCLENWNKGDNGILFLSRAYQARARHGLADRSGHPARAGIARHLRAAGGKRRVRDVSVRSRRPDHAVGLMTKDVLPEHHNDLDYLVNLLDWDANVNPTFAADNRCFPKPVAPFAQTEPDGYREQWITYGTGWYSAKELTVLPKRSVTIKDAAAYGLILTQGYGRFGKLPVSTPTMIRFGQMTEDELFVTEAAAKDGVRIENLSATDPLVILKHFGPGNPDAEGLKKKR